MGPLIIRSGGQTGVDRAALEVAARFALCYSGWCPAGGWAEDHPAPPGIRALYPELRETPASDPRQRTAWNVRDADATLIVAPVTTLDLSPGSRFAQVCAELVFVKPVRILDPDNPGARAEAVSWIRTLMRRRDEGPFELNVAGPRTSESPGVHDRAAAFLSEVLEGLAVRSS